MDNISSKLGAALNRAAKNAPVSQSCPLIKNPKWNCKPHDKGNEPFCHSVSGYTGCVHYQQWFHFILAKAIAKEMVNKETKKK